MKELLLYCPPSQLNEATEWYVGTLATAALSFGYALRHVTRLADVGTDSTVLVVQCKGAFKLRLLRPRARIWMWMQGVYPEEARLHMGSRAREWLQRFFEWFSLPALRGVVLVSEAMRCHFADRYGARMPPTFVMPCVNADLCPTCFDRPGKYDHPRFVYAGGMHAWQCIDETLDVFKRIRDRLPQATLTLLTRDAEAARAMVQKKGIEGVEIDHVPLAELQSRLADFKYGFVLRRHHVVNRVATPTKVSSYMAAGVIPVTTTAVQDYAAALRDVHPMVMVGQLDVDAVAAAVLALDAQTLQPAAVRDRYRRVFETYFDPALYGPGLREFFKRTGLDR
ncbi:MAG: hypothetical protein ABIN96_00080 [Rubrivivax sp.]